ncbi:patatin-like phospholipase family protein [Pseudomonas nicosulfuronedens]|uniref:Patatin-like phospholipase family protein n=1 Tax=Pseudomonas nicosulfuronedens TaxID=2571105 RepID=A0A5R9RAW6_9PSED|nr:patatin-like phospholipase family protein [Pseudomonas nicosulfuronedens]MDH1010915.1 patatin-like phospholipase family protein [Pseudomonas nicosulfuronedens]MDH1979438.1 patatin-like phospholipase family protein [Pseudomonas nicosulfuronedens]MDH2026685.1 patatin-like phospholipase family protein [Pseudomonas nicosulfuronedens]TLX79399.1 patatin-like phospholipase family protein [Pseudomonas nicosulfuronedens]
MTAIQIKTPALTLKAGSRALQRIREQGLSPDDVGILPGAAGGPKALGIQGLDLALFGEWLPRAPRERSLIGASIGSWRFASACLPDPAAGIRRLGELYTQQRFARNASISDVSKSCAKMLDDLLDGHDASVLDNPWYRLNVVVVKSHGRLAQDGKANLGLGLGAVIRDNLVGRRHLHRHFERLIIHDARRAPPLEALSDFPSRYLHLDLANLRHALLASGSIPMVMEGVRDIPGAGPGTYRDGGLLDYHLDLPYQPEGVVLYPHFTDKVIPGWFDKGLPWRRGDAGRLQDVLLLAPSKEYLAQLPHNKLPDRKDFHRYIGDDAGRERYWRKAMDESRRMGDEFLELVDSGRLGERLQPLT